MIVMKFGGASVENANAIGRLCRSANAGPDFVGKYGESCVQATIEP